MCYRDNAHNERAHIENTLIGRGVVLLRMCYRDNAHNERAHNQGHPPLPVRGSGFRLGLGSRKRLLSQSRSPTTACSWFRV
jgi:hypothetical protein